ncbi:MAG: Lrp/AsnC family transcriptional regulator [Pseudomonadota bacterium]
MDETIDKIDRAILRELQKDAGQSVDAVADRVNLSRNATWRRIKRLEEAGVIRARRAYLDAAKLGLGLTALVLIRAAEHSDTWLQEFQAAAQAMPEIESAERMSGELDYVLRIRVADMAAYDRFYKRLVARIPIKDISASFVMEEIKEGGQLPV